MYDFDLNYPTDEDIPKMITHCLRHARVFDQNEIKFVSTIAERWQDGGNLTDAQRELLAEIYQGLIETLDSEAKLIERKENN
jgi:hypothetical protein